MTRTIRPAGTVLCGQGMLAQLHHEISLSHAHRPGILCLPGNLRHAHRVARLMGPGIGSTVPVCTGDIPVDWDFLILAGGRAPADMTSHDKRFRALVPLCSRDLEDIAEPLADYLVLDQALVASTRKDQLRLARFLDDFARSLIPGFPGPYDGAFVPGMTLTPTSREIPGFVYSAITIVYAGDSALEKLPGLLEEMGVRKSLLLTDRGIENSRILAMVLQSIPGRDTVVFKEIPQDSDLNTVNQISRTCREEGCDGILALGGGSVLDTAKGVVLNVGLNTDDVFRHSGSGCIPRLKVPFITIPTTSGTGSEVTRAAVIADPVKHRKVLINSPNLASCAAILDSRLTLSLPPHLTSITGMDAVSHAVEAFTCLGKNPLSDHMALTALGLLRDHLAAAVREPGNLSHRRALALASNLAGQAFSNSMVGMVHSIGHSVGSVCHVPHGSCMAVLLPAALEYNFGVIEPLLAELYPVAGGGESEAAAGDSGMRETEKARGTIEIIRRWNRDLKELTGGRHPVRLRDLTDSSLRSLVNKSDFDEIAEKALGDGSIIYNPVELRYEDIIRVLEECW